jgi:hypothetical protein
LTGIIATNVPANAWLANSISSCMPSSRGERRYSKKKRQECSSYFVRHIVGGGWHSVFLLTLWVEETGGCGSLHNGKSDGAERKWVSSHGCMARHHGA